MMRCRRLGNVMANEEGEMGPEIELDHDGGVACRERTGMGWARRLRPQMGGNTDGTGRTAGGEGIQHRHTLHIRGQRRARTQADHSTLIASPRVSCRCSCAHSTAYSDALRNFFVAYFLQTCCSQKPSSVSFSMSSLWPGSRCSSVKPE